MPAVRQFAGRFDKLMAGTPRSCKGCFPIGKN